ncbi:hypothetical protein [Phenylobacterium sp.]|jgi:UDP-N-acetylmuramyl pentapeptide phosphotransferase/UDP-N-acetylglucosamine-1-phosphate transferase|uniref:hypothetical protein n=1 Tax=Phenylobacterium sp. TaxID=1871053 RepID=UPI002E34F2F5|nr:hypothetical protein [Phenylobacterium sp.]HEX3364728.1 hypothetical protein [Phenylobacterium sp.]
MRRPDRTPPERTEHVHHHIEDPGAQAVRTANRLGLIGLLLLAVFAYVLWSHPNYVPACAGS